MKSIKNFRKSITGKIILISGGAGFIGSHLVEECLKYNPKKIIVVDDLSVGKIINLKKFLKKIFFLKKDCENFKFLKNLFTKQKIDIVFNLATLALPFSINFPRKTFETNVKITLNFLELLKNRKYKTLCHFSSSEIYGSAKYIPMDENHPKNPTTTYAAGKLSADQAVLSYYKMFNLDAFILRPFNNYGPNQLISRKEIGVVPNTIKRIKRNLSPIIYGSGKQKRDFIYVKDTVFYTLKIFRKVKPGEEINLTNKNVINIKKLILKIMKIMNFDKKIIYKSKRIADVFYHYGDNKKLKKLIKIKKENFNKNLNETINSYY